MYFVDSQRTVTRRDSSLVLRKHTGDEKAEYDTLSLAYTPFNIPLTSDSGVSFTVRPTGSVQKELVTMMFESMLNSIVESWDVIVPLKSEDNTAHMKVPSDHTITSRRKKSILGEKVGKPPKTSKRSKLELSDSGQVDPIHLRWWSSPDERAIVRFRNGNIYEGSISMKCMHGAGRFKWADGTVYLGEFQENKMTGKGTIQWKDDTWYEGEFAGNLRHGKGLYVDSRNQRSYAGGWHCGTKHGQGAIFYSGTFKNSYDGDWVHNVRHGFGTREYSADSGYKGYWDKYIREGKGLMIWPNHDFYRGEWKNGVMSGYGMYIWDTYYNNTLSLPSISVYRGLWLKGQRHGRGVLNLGLGMGSYYKGEFKTNKKHGFGRFVTNNGLILQHRNLYVDDNIGPIADEPEIGCCSQECCRMVLDDPYKFDICDSTVGLLYHVQEAIKNIDKQIEVRANIISDYLENNKNVEVDIGMVVRKNFRQEEVSAAIDFDDLVEFEESSLRKSLRCYETQLRNIYFKYATICNQEEIQFTPVLIRLFLWQMFYDCNIHEKGLTLLDIDKMYNRNPQWLSNSEHNPFEKIYFWQFLHCMISVASKLYAKRELPGPKPDTILAIGFRTFMEKDILPNVGRRKGRLVDVYGQYTPLKGLYALYRRLGEPHTVRSFLRATRRPPHYADPPQPPLLDAPDHCLPLGRNTYIIGDEISFVADEELNEDCEETDEKELQDLKLFNFGNLTSKAIIKIFSHIFPQLCKKQYIMNLDVEITFFEFFEVFIACAEESIRVKEEEIRWREKFSSQAMNVPTTPTSNKTK